MGPTKSVNTITLETIDTIVTSPSVKTRLIFTIINVQQAISTIKARFALTSVAALGVCTSGSMTTRIIPTLINVFVTVSAGESQRTRAKIIPVVGGRRTSGAVGAPIWRTRIHFKFAGLAGVGRITDAFEIIDVINAGSVIATWSMATIIDVCFTIMTGVAFSAVAEIGVEMSRTLASMLARIGLAQIHFQFALLALISWSAFANELIETVLTGTTVYAWINGTFVHV